MLSITIKPIIPVKPREIDKPLILIIDNNSDNIETAKALLQTDYSVLEAATAKEGIEKIRTQSPNLVLLDINLPDMDGVETLNLIREIPAFGTIPIIAYTANAMTGAEDDYLAKGFDGYLSKPIDIDTFEESIRKWLKH